MYVLVTTLWAVLLCVCWFVMTIKCLSGVQMPHYHAEEATRAIKPVLGDYYMWDSREVCDACVACGHLVHCSRVQGATCSCTPCKVHRCACGADQSNNLFHL
jgi:uncharacterized protein YjaG (DUF416 family)